LSEGITPSIVSRASKSSLGSLLQLLEGKIPALKNFTSTKVEYLRETLSFSMRVRDESIVHQSGSPVNSSPVSSLAIIARTSFTNVDTNIRKVLRGAVVLIVRSIRSVDIRISLLLNFEWLH
jgi:hypothetical protein